MVRSTGRSSGAMVVCLSDLTDRQSLRD